jgi:hypothetical protein
MRCVHSYHLLDNLIPPPAEDMIENIGEKSEDDSEMEHLNPRSFLIVNTDFQQCYVKLQWSLIRLLRYHEVIPNTVLGIFVNYVQSIIADEDVD